MSNEEILKSHEVLDNFITNKHINTFISFPKKSEFSDDFINWLSPKYYEAFMSIYKENIGTKTEAKVIKLINSPWYCNAETENKIVDFFMPQLEKTLELSKQFRVIFETKSHDLEAVITHSPTLIKQVLNPINKALFRHKHDRFLPVTDRIIDDCLDISDKLKRYKARDIEFKFSSAVLDAMKTVGFNAAQQERYNSFIKKSDTSIKTSHIITIVVALFALVRLVMAFA